MNKHKSKMPDPMTDEQVRVIIERVALAVASPEDQEFFRGLMWIRFAERPHSFPGFIANMLKL